MKLELKTFINKRINELTEEIVNTYNIREHSSGETRGIMNTRLQYLEQHLKDLKKIQKICVDRNRF